MTPAIISRAAFAVSWTTTYPSLLSSAAGRLVTRNGYASVFSTLGTDLHLPWEDNAEEQHWSRFWSLYLGSPGKIRNLRPDAAWDRVIPYQVIGAPTIDAPAGVEAHADVLVYPSAISVIVRSTVTGTWPLDRLASSLAAIRKSHHWGLTTSQSTSTDRNLDGLASDLRDDAAALLTTGDPPVSGPQTVLTVAAPIAGDGDAASFDLAEPVARSCLAGLAVLGPPGQLVDIHLLEQNSDPRFGGRVYALGGGHAIWHPTYFIQQPNGDPIGCLHHNQTDLVSHIAGLGGIVSWAGDQVAARVAIPAPVQPLVKRAVLRLEQLHGGLSTKTYRSGIAKVRIEPLLATLSKVSAAL